MSKTASEPPNFTCQHVVFLRCSKGCFSCQKLSQASHGQDSLAAKDLASLSTERVVLKKVSSSGVNLVTTQELGSINQKGWPGPELIEKTHVNTTLKHDSGQPTPPSPLRASAGRGHSLRTSPAATCRPRKSLHCRHGIAAGLSLTMMSQSLTPDLGKQG